MTRSLRLVKQLVRADHRVVKGSSKSIGEVTRVSHFVRSSGREREEEEMGEGFKASGERVMLQISS